MSADPADGNEAPGDQIRLVVLFGGRSAEHDVSCVTASHVLAALDHDRYVIEPVGITRDGHWVRADAARSALESGCDALPEQLSATGTGVEPLAVIQPTDGQSVVVLPLLHGPFGEDGTMQGLLELSDVPYVGAGVLGSSLAMDKAKSKEVLANAGIPQARFLAFHQSEITGDRLSAAADDLGLPIFVKPANMGSSIGVSKAGTHDQLAAAVDLAGTYDEWVVLEETVDGREIEIAVLGNLDPLVSVPGEVRSAAEFYDYEDKYVDGRAELLIPASLPDDVSAEVRRLALFTYRTLRAEGMARVDFFYEEAGRGLLVNEINTIPGFTPISMYPQLWEASGLAYPDLIDELVRYAIERHDRRRSSQRMSRSRPLDRGGTDREAR